jgi:hypothetical protein
MGSPSYELGRVYIFENQHEISIEKQFYLQKTEVTQRQWEEVMGNNPSFFSNCGDNCPVENVSWSDVKRFIWELNRSSATNRYRLPTEAEWEYACRAGSTSAFSNGGLEESGCHKNSSLDDIAWYSCNSGNMPHPVGRKMPNKMGLYDMHGNVSEWCQDDFKVDYSKSFRPDPIEIDLSSEKAVRGGSWSDNPLSCRSASRLNLKSSRKDRRVGFRLIRESKYYKIKVPPSPEPVKKVSEDSKPHIVATSPTQKPTQQINFEDPTLFTIQVKSTKSLAYAEGQVERFRKRGYAAFFEKVNITNKGIWYRICFGKFKSKSEAELFRKKLVQDNLDGIIIEISIM